MHAAMAECAALSALAERKQRVTQAAEHVASRASAALETSRAAADRARAERVTVEASLSDVEGALVTSAAAALKAKEAAQLRPSAAMADAIEQYVSRLEHEREELQGTKRQLEQLEAVPGVLEAKANAARNAADAQVRQIERELAERSASLPPALVQFAEQCGRMRDEGERRKRKLEARLEADTERFEGTGCFQKQLAERREAVDEQRKLLAVVEAEERVVIAELTAAVGSMPDAAALKGALQVEAKALEEASPAVAAAVRALLPSKKRSWWSFFVGG